MKKTRPNPTETRARLRDWPVEHMKYLALVDGFHLSG